MQNDYLGKDKFKKISSYMVVIVPTRKKSSSEYGAYPLARFPRLIYRGKRAGLSADGRYCETAPGESFFPGTSRIRAAASINQT